MIMESVSDSLIRNMHVGSLQKSFYRALTALFLLLRALDTVQGDAANLSVMSHVDVQSCSHEGRVERNGLWPTPGKTIPFWEFPHYCLSSAPVVTFAAAKQVKWIHNGLALKLERLISLKFD